MALIAMASVTNGVRWTNGSTIQTAPSLAELLDQLDQPTAIVCEPEFYDALRDVRRHLEEWLGEREHQLVPISRQAKELLELAGGDLIEGRGVARLFALATVGSYRIVRIRQGQDIWTVRDALEVAHVVDVFLPRGEVLVDALRAVGPYDGLDPETRNALGNGHGYQLDVLLAAYRAASVARCRSEFEQLLGMNARGHGALVRTIRNWYTDRNTGVEDEFVRESVLTWAAYRRALRRLFHRIGEARRSEASRELVDPVAGQLIASPSSAAA